MRIIKRAALQQAAKTHPKAKSTLEHWYRVVKAAEWRNFIQTQQTFRHADQVKVKSGRITTVFNVTNDFRLITAIHYDRTKVFILRFLTHAEYDKDTWKNDL